MVATQNIVHRQLVDAMPHIGQRTLDPSIAPGGILLGHANHQLLDLLRHGWPPQRCAVFAAVKFWVFSRLYQRMSVSGVASVAIL